LGISRFQKLWNPNRPLQLKKPRANVAEVLTRKSSPANGFAWIAFNWPAVAAPATRRRTKHEVLAREICRIPLSRLAFFLFTGKFQNNLVEH
jgi:hypothetical protein